MRGSAGQPPGSYRAPEEINRDTELRSFHRPSLTLPDVKSEVAIVLSPPHLPNGS